ncbi:MAG: ATP-binding protein [Planctomycetia bacterium]
MKDQMLQAVQEKLADSAAMSFPRLTRREADGSLLPGKARAVIGMRRAGKTSFLYQCLADRLAAGTAREKLVYFNFEDERLAGMQAADLGTVFDAYYRAHASFRRQETVTWCFDEIQVVTGWEAFVRRVLDAEKVEVFLSGSSARMLSREVATSMRGRALETVITPFSFREFCAARGEAVAGKLLSAASRSRMEAGFDSYLQVGGFPEALAVSTERQRVELLQGYVDSVLFRDVAERHAIGNLVALRAFARQLLRRAATLFSVSKVYADFKSRGVGVSKETLLRYLEHFEDAFLVFTVPLAAGSERRRQVNPRKLYLVDHGLAHAFSPAGGLNRGHLIENIVACEFQRHSRDLAYVKTAGGGEVDFLATAYDGSRTLAQVASDLTEPGTLKREIKSLVEAAEDFPDARRVLLCETALPRGGSIPEGIEVIPVWRWLLDQSCPS